MVQESNTVSTMAVITAGTLSQALLINRWQQKPDSPPFSLDFTEEAITFIKGQNHLKYSYLNNAIRLPAS